MCWKYEDEYQDCFDYLTFSMDDEPCLMDVIRNHLSKFGVEFVGDFDKLFFDMLSKAHEEGIIKPIKVKK